MTTIKDCAGVLSTSTFKPLAGNPLPSKVGFSGRKRRRVENMFADEEEEDDDDLYTPFFIWSRRRELLIAMDGWIDWLLFGAAFTTLSIGCISQLPSQNSHLYNYSFHSDFRARVGTRLN
ncbi:hypothetical protein HAX54_025931 [Datura stramonium]|uniref:Uncharacterized protein n=1 Tax=Datura stramonium TaxID=4076 RepID=A0ABS8V0K5_DATST|nr:hypothetical protein [Datura stramonium]